MGVDLSGRRAVVTGGASGIGWETARVLAKAGAEVTIAVRRGEAGARAAQRIHDGAVRVEPLDLADLGSVRQFADRRESQFAVNHLGHAALMLNLHDALRKATDARVVVSSILFALGATIERLWDLTVEAVSR